MAYDEAHTAQFRDMLGGADRQKDGYHWPSAIPPAKT